jgi:hypothetical protein
VTDPSEKRYQVFVSSTFRDLEPERQKVLQALLEMKAFPAGMELFPSADDDQWEFIKREILSSDYYVVIIAGKYGSLAPDGISYTEKEYDFAVESGKPVMAFLYKHLGQLTGTHLELDPVPRERLAAFRAKAERGKLVNFYSNPDELKSQVWHSVTHAITLRPQEGWVRGKNLRRVEDLEEITQLQRNVIALEAEIARLSRDPARLLAQGDDLAEWLVQRLVLSESQVAVPAAPLRTSWSQLLLALFGSGNQDTTDPIVFNTVKSLCLSQFADRTDPNEFQLDPDSLYRVVTDIRIQLAGLNYIEFDHRRFWLLTSVGRQQIALLRGHRRT